MHRRKGTRNASAEIIQEIMAKHELGATRKELAEEYGMPFKTIKSMIWRENRKARQQAEGLEPTKTRGRKPAVTLAEYKYENK
ncbi:hypothetical protein [Caproiciproducens sp.]